MVGPDTRARDNAGCGTGDPEIIPMRRAGLRPGSTSMSTSEPPSRVWDCERMFRKRCPQSWQILDSTPVAEVRHCRECDRDVYLCRTPNDFVAHGERGHCVAIPDVTSSLPNRLWDWATLRPRRCFVRRN